MLGVNQVIMQCLAMVVIAAFIGAPGLGYRLLIKLQTLKLGQSVEIGIAIVLLAIALDRLSLAWAAKMRDYTANLPFYVRYKYQIVLVIAVIACYVAAQFFPLLATVPKKMTISTAPYWEAMIDWTVINWYDGLLAFRTFVVVDILIPLRDAVLYAPTIAVFVLIAGAGLILGGWYSALLASMFFVFIALSGWWDRAMITAYMVLFAVFVCIVVGIPVGIWASRKPRRAKILLLICDTFQTFPSFIYLLPVIMLFQVNDLSAIASVIVYAIIPVVRYTIEGLRNVPLALHEAVTMAGGNKRQRLFQLELPVRIAAYHAWGQSDDDVRLFDGDHRRIHRHHRSRPGDLQGAVREQSGQGPYVGPVRLVHGALGRSSDHSMGPGTQTITRIVVMSIEQPTRPKLLEPGLLPFVPGLERHRAPGGGACVVSLAPGDEIALTDHEGCQRCEVVVLGADGGEDFGALGLDAREPASGCCHGNWLVSAAGGE